MIVPVGLLRVIVCCTHRPSSHSMVYNEVGVGASADKDKLYQNSPTAGWKNITLEGEDNIENLMKIKYINTREFIENKLNIKEHLMCLLYNFVASQRSSTMRHQYHFFHSKYSYINMKSKTDLPIHSPTTAGAYSSTYTPRPDGGSVTESDPDNPILFGLIWTSRVMGASNGLFKPISNKALFYKRISVMWPFDLRIIQLTRQKADQCT